MRYDYVSAGFYTFDCLGWPFTEVPEGGGTVLLEDLTLAVSGAAGSAAIAAVRLGLSTLAIGGFGTDLEGDWACARLQELGVDISGIQRLPDVRSSASIVLTRRDGSRPALHRRGATGAFFVPPEEHARLTDARVVHLGGVGLMDAMDGAPNAALLKQARARGAVTTVDVFAGSPADMPDVAAVLPFTDHFLPSVEEAQALTGLDDLDAMAERFFELGARACTFTLGAGGAWYRDREGQSFRQPAFAVDVVCTCGCGDVFNAGFAAGLVQGLSAPETVRLAQACSALNATGLGSQAGIRSLEQVRAFMRETALRTG